MIGREKQGAGELWNLNNINENLQKAQVIYERSKLIKVT
jgi:hypothetical protein